jgi:LPS sulfotransferase NodH
MDSMKVISTQIPGFLRSHLKEYMISLNGHKDYTKFIILARSRTGSNLLRSLLNEHSQVKVYSELVRSDENIDWGFPEVPKPKSALALYQKDPVAFLEKRIFGKYPPGTRAVGFKLFYYHAAFEKGKQIWSYLSSQTDVKIIHLKRKNILATHLSRKKADITGSWANVTGKSEEQAQFTLDYEDCLHDFQRTRAWEQDYDLFFNRHPLLDVTYENLSTDYQAEIKRVQEFLELPEERVAPKTYKQTNLPLSESIYNFRELKERFQGTQWEEFFADD